MLRFSRTLEEAAQAAAEISRNDDVSAESKAELAKDLAAVVSFLALNNMDRVLLYITGRCPQ